MPTPAHFLTSDDGNLYDTRVDDWHTRPPLRVNFERSHREIKSTRDLLATLRAGPYAWPGGYPLYFLTSDGAALSFATVRAELRYVISAIRNRWIVGWRVVACDINWEDSDLVDDHTGESIESAYGDDDNATE